MNNRGGTRPGSGRKRSDLKKIRISTSLSVDVVDYLNSRTDKPKAQIIEEALREHQKRDFNMKDGSDIVIPPLNPNMDLDMLLIWYPFTDDQLESIKKGEIKVEWDSNGIQLSKHKKSTSQG